MRADRRTAAERDLLRAAAGAAPAAHRILRPAGAAATAAAAEEHADGRRRQPAARPLAQHLDPGAASDRRLDAREPRAAGAPARGRRGRSAWLAPTADPRRQPGTRGREDGRRPHPPAPGNHYAIERARWGKSGPLGTGSGDPGSGHGAGRPGVALAGRGRAGCTAPTVSLPVAAP